MRKIQGKIKAILFNLLYYSVPSSYGWYNGIVSPSLSLSLSQMLQTRPALCPLPASILTLSLLLLLPLLTLIPVVTAEGETSCSEPQGPQVCLPHEWHLWKQTHGKTYRSNISSTELKHAIHVHLICIIHIMYIYVMHTYYAQVKSKYFSHCLCVFLFSILKCPSLFFYSLCVCMCVCVCVVQFIQD